MTALRPSSGPRSNWVEIQEMRDVPQEVGGAALQAFTVAQCWASIEPLSARELILAAQTQVRSAVKIVIDWFEGLTEKHRILWSDRGRARVFAIDAVIDTEMAHAEHVLLCTESP
jgi:SPP1 family predicted phage head-tail adaptor